jgi:hypothetical protein
MVEKDLGREEEEEQKARKKHVFKDFCRNGEYREYSFCV